MFPRNGPMFHQRSRKENSQWTHVHCKSSIPKHLFFLESTWLLCCHTCTFILCQTWSSNLEVKRWETLPSKIVSSLRNSQNEGVFRNPQRSRVTRKHKYIWFISILPPPGPSHPRGAAEAAAVPPSNISLQCQLQLSSPFFPGWVPRSELTPRNTPLPNTAERDTTYGLDVSGAGASQVGQKQSQCL